MNYVTKTYGGPMNYPGGSYANGGIVGLGTDTVPAWLTPGEAVISPYSPYKDKQKNLLSQAASWFGRTVDHPGAGGRATPVVNGAVAAPTCRSTSAIRRTPGTSRSWSTASCTHSAPRSTGGTGASWPDRDVVTQGVTSGRTRRRPWGVVDVVVDVAVAVGLPCRARTAGGRLHGHEDSRPPSRPVRRTQGHLERDRVAQQTPASAGMSDCP